MRKLALAFAVIVSLASLAIAGCKHGPGSAKLEGRWRGTRADGVGQPATDAANTFARQTEIIARGSLITISTPAAKGQHSRFVVDEESTTSLVLHTERDGADNKETFVFSEDGRTMTWRLGENRTITFSRVKE